MKHFSDAAWADFVRNVISQAARATMQNHIDNGCEKCSSELQLWQNVLSIAQQESALVPPDGVVRMVKSEFLAMAPQPKRGFRLLFDSNLQPLTAGIRGSISARQFLYETDDFYIDLRLEPRREADRACVIGQVLNRIGKDRSTEGVAVRIRKGRQRLAETTANRFGEFQIEFDASKNLCISISGGEEDEIILPLYGVHAEPVEGKDLD